MLYGIEPFFTNWKILKQIETTDPSTQYPAHVRLDLTELCNYRCAFCWWQSPERFSLVTKQMTVEFNGKRHFKLEDILHLIDEFVEIGVKAVSLTGSGDPLVSTVIGPVLEKLHSVGIAFGLTSNFGMKISGEIMGQLENAKWLRWSLNAGSRNVYLETNRPRGGNAQGVYDRALKNISEIVTRRAKRKCPVINASVVVFETNREDLVEAIILTANLGVDSIAFRPDLLPQRCDNKGGYDEIVMNKLQRAKAIWQTEKFKIHLNIERQNDHSYPENLDLLCFYSNHSVMITANGDLYPCCYTHGRPQYKIGNVIEEGFKNLWYSEKRKLNYKKLSVKNCPPCPYVKVNETLHNMYSGKALASTVYIHTTEDNIFV